MRLAKWSGCALAAVVLAGAGGLSGAFPAAASQPQLTSTGSSFAGVAISQWQGQFNEVDGGDINFTVTSSVIGMNNFCNKTVDFGATDIAYSTQQANCTTNAVPYPFQYMPDVAGGLAFEYHLKAKNGQQITNLVLNAAAITGIFTGSISRWDDPAIQALNPNTLLPNEAIHPYYRSDPSGENYLLSDYMLHTDAGPITTFQQLASVPTPPGQPSATWASFPNGVPPQFSGLFGVNGADAASQGPANTEGGIAYVETAYAKNVGLPVASVVNAAGYATQPSSYNVAVALTGAILYSDLTQNLGGVYTNPDSNTYPISAYSYFIAQCVPSQAATQNFACDSSGPVTMGTSQGAEMAQFIHFVACDGQAKMATLGYSPLPPNLVEDDFQAAGRLPGGTTPPPPTAQNCANPYITGAVQPVGNPQQVQSSNPGSDVGTTAGTSAASASGPHGSSSGPTNSSKSSVTGTAAGPYSGGAVAHHTQNPLDNAQLTGQRQEALASAAGRGLLGWSPLDMALWSAAIAIVLVAIPLGAWVWQRRRGSAPNHDEHGAVV